MGGTKVIRHQPIKSPEEVGKKTPARDFPDFRVLERRTLVPL